MHDECIDFALCVDGWTDIIPEASLCDSIGKPSPCKMF